MSNILPNDTVSSFNKKKKYKWWEEINKTVSAPILCYFALIILSLMIIILAILAFDGSKLGSFLGNIGYGIFGSTFVAGLIDYGATKRQIKNDRKELIVLTNDLRRSVNELIFFRNRYGHLLGKDCYDMEYNKWALKLSDVSFDFDNHEISLVQIVSGYLMIIDGFAKKLRDNSVVLVGNLCLPEGYFHNLDHLILSLDTIIDEKDKSSSFNFNLMIENVLELIARILPEYRSIFFEKWDSAEMTQKYRTENNEPFS